MSPKLIFGKIGANKLSTPANGAGKGRVLPVNIIKQPAAEEKLVYQVVVNAGVNVSKPSDSPNEETAVTWIKPLDKPSEFDATNLDDNDMEQSDKQKPVESVSSEQPGKPENSSVHKITFPSRVAAVSMVTPSPNTATKTPIAQNTRSEARSGTDQDIIIKKIDPIVKSLSDDAENQTATNSSILPEQLEQFQNILFQIMEDDSDIMDADKEKGKWLFALLLVTTVPLGSPLNAQISMLKEISPSQHAILPDVSVL